MTPTDLQKWLGAHGSPVVVDGKPGPKTRAAIVSVFTNPCAPGVTPDEVAEIAKRLGVSTKQVAAVAKVESSGSGFDSSGRPKILFERHKFHSATGGKWSVASFSNPKAGGYDQPSWDKLTQAACLDADAAFASTSWGAFQVMGFHWEVLGYPSAIEMAYSTVTGLGAHYDMLARFIEANRLQDEMRLISSDPVTCRPFAKAYNGEGYAKFGYDIKIASAMK